MRAFGLPTPLVFVGLAVFVPHAGSALQTFEDVRPGAQIRVFAPNFNSNYLRGTVLTLPDSLLTMRWSGEVLTVPLRDILRLDIRRQPRSVWRRVVVSGIGGAVVGPLLVAMLRLGCAYGGCDPMDAGDVALASLAGAGVAATMTATLGAMENVSRPWYPVTVPRNRFPNETALAPLVRIQF